MYNHAVVCIIVYDLVYIVECLLRALNTFILLDPPHPHPKQLRSTKERLPGGAAVAQRLSGENEKINEIQRTRVRSPPRATS
jgi:hypothetical protein